MDFMQIYNITSAKAHFPRLVEKAAGGEPFVTTRAGKPMVKVIAFDSPEPPRMKHFGFMAGQINAPRDFNTLGARRIQRLFEGKK